MENITLGQIAVAIAFIAALITGGIKIKDTVKKWIENLLKGKFDELEKADRENIASINKSIGEIKTQVGDLKNDINRVDLENCKNYLVTFLAENEKLGDRGEQKSEMELQRFWEEYEHYEQHGGNSYIHEKVQKQKSKGYL